MTSSNEGLTERVTKLERLAMMQNLSSTKKILQESDDHSASRHRRHSVELSVSHSLPHTLPPPPPPIPKSRVPPPPPLPSRSPALLNRKKAAPSSSYAHPPWVGSENPHHSNPNYNLNGNPIFNPNSNANFNPHSANLNTTSLIQELERTRRRSVELEELVQKAERETALLRADKMCMFQALDYSREDPSLSHLEGEEAERLVELVRCENNELLEMVASQHSLLEKQQARANSAEREVDRLYDEVEIMRTALEGVGEREEILIQRAEAAERLLAMLVKVYKEREKNGVREDVKASGSLNLPSLSPLSSLSSTPPALSTSTSSSSTSPLSGPSTLSSSSASPSPSPSPSLSTSPSPLKKDSMGGETSSNCSLALPCLSAIGKVVGRGILAGDNFGPETQHSASHKMFQQQQQLLLTLLQNSLEGEREVEREGMGHWVFHALSLLTTAAAAVAVTTLVVNFRRRA